MIKKLKPLDYPEGSMLFDVRYYRKPECFEVVYLDPITKQLEVKYEDPIIDIWFLKEEFRTNKYQITQTEMDKCFPVYCKPSQVGLAIATMIGGEWKDLYDQMKQSNVGSYDMNKKLCECPWVFKADFVPDVYFRLRWIQQYGEDACDITKVTYGLMDIEVDTLDRVIDLKDTDHAPQPINAISLILPHVKIAVSFVLGPRSESQIHRKFHDLLKKQKEEYDWLIGHVDEYKRKIVEDDEDNKDYLKDFDIRVHTFDFDHEIDMIKTMYDYINKYRPMFVMSWNAPFDDNYLPNRIKYLGYDPRDIIIPKEFKTQQYYFKPDRDTKNFSVKNSKDWFFTSTYSIYICQMRTFAAVRKSQQERRSYSLSAVGKEMAHIDKLSDTKTGTFRTFAYMDFIKFLLYNMRDTVVQYAVEEACHDCQAIMARSYSFLTQFSKNFQETHIVRNTKEYFYEAQNIIQSCTLLIEPGIDTAFKGAFVAPPEKNSPTGYVLNGKYINNVMYGVLDADAKAYYPSTKMGYNLDPMALIYKCVINNDAFTSGNSKNRSFNQEYVWYDTKNRPHAEDMSGPMLNSYKNGNISSVLYNWFNIPSMSDYFSFIDQSL